MGCRPPCQFPRGPADQAHRCIAGPEQRPSTPALRLFPPASSPIHLPWTDGSEGLSAQPATFFRAQIAATRDLPKSDACGGNVCPDPPQQLRPYLGLASGQRMLLQCLENTQRARDFPGACREGNWAPHWNHRALLGPFRSGGTPGMDQSMLGASCDMCPLHPRPLSTYHKGPRTHFTRVDGYGISASSASPAHGSAVGQCPRCAKGKGSSGCSGGHCCLEGLHK